MPSVDVVAQRDDEVQLSWINNLEQRFKSLYISMNITDREYTLEAVNFDLS